LDSHFFTAGQDECRAWTIRAGDKAPAAAGVIHSDFEKGFIKAEVYHYDDLIQYGSEAAVRAAGKMRQEGRDYEVQDGDIMFSNSMSERHHSAVSAKQERRKRGIEYFEPTILHCL